MIAVTAEPGRLARVLAARAHICRGRGVRSLSEEERRWLDEQTRPGVRVVPMSVAYKRCISCWLGEPHARPPGRHEGEANIDRKGDGSRNAGKRSKRQCAGAA